MSSSMFTPKNVVSLANASNHISSGFSEGSYTCLPMVRIHGNHRVSFCVTEFPGPYTAQRHKWKPGWKNGGDHPVAKIMLDISDSGSAEAAARWLEDQANLIRSLHDPGQNGRALRKEMGFDEYLSLSIHDEYPSLDATPTYKANHMTTSGAAFIKKPASISPTEWKAMTTEEKRLVARHEKSALTPLDETDIEP